MPNEKANKEVEKIQYLNRHCNTNENSEKAKKRKYAQADQRATSLASRFYFSKSKSYLDVCLSGGAKRRHLSMTSTRRGAKFYVIILISSAK